jgi:hypothetical protein
LGFEYARSLGGWRAHRRRRSRIAPKQSQLPPTRDRRQADVADIASADLMVELAMEFIWAHRRTDQQRRASMAAAWRRFNQTQNPTGMRRWQSTPAGI